MTRISVGAGWFVALGLSAVLWAALILIAVAVMALLEVIS